MYRSIRFLLLSSLALLPAVAVAATSEAERQKELVARALAEATATCDKGAAAPLDPDAKAPPMQFVELLPYDLDMTKVEALQSACQQAWAGAPKEKRLQLQWLRVTVALRKPGKEWLLVPQIRMLADAGSAEARYLMFRMYTLHHTNLEGASFQIGMDEALGYLRAAAEQGHMSALMDLMMQYRSGPLLRPDIKEAVRIGRRLESAPPQGIAETPYEIEIRERMPVSIAVMTLTGNGFSLPEQRIAFGILEKDSQAGTNDHYSALTYIKALRLGRGTASDLVKARQLLEARIDSDAYAVPMFADMLAKGEGGPADGRRALALLCEERMKYVSDAGGVLAGLLLDGKVVGRQPQEAIQALSRSSDRNDQIRLAGLLLDYHTRLLLPDRLIEALTNAADLGDSEAAIALAKLKLSDNSQFTDIAGGRALLKPLVDADNREAVWLYASSQYGNLATDSSQPYRLPDGLSDQELRKLIETGMEKKEPQAFLLRAKLTRKGAVYPQDDQAATKLLISAANLGSVDAMVRLGNAYDDGLGIAKDPRERLHAWRQAARRGSLVARQNLANAFTFDTFDKLMTLDEGVTGPLVLYINSVDRTGTGFAIDDTMAQVRLGTIFSFGSRAMEAGAPAVADAVMNAFREAPAGLDEKTLVTLGKAFPDEIKTAIERPARKDAAVEIKAMDEEAAE